jgi:hypothetical protein
VNELCISGLFDHLRETSVREGFVPSVTLHMPDKFRTPGSAAVNVNAPGGSVTVGIVVDAKVQAELMAMRQESLRRIQEKKAKAVEVGSKPPNGGLNLGTPPAPPVPLPS